MKMIIGMVQIHDFTSLLISTAVELRQASKILMTHALRILLYS